METLANLAASHFRNGKSLALKDGHETVAFFTQNAVVHSRPIDFPSSSGRPNAGKHGLQYRAAALFKRESFKMPQVRHHALPDVRGIALHASEAMWSNKSSCARQERWEAWGRLFFGFEEFDHFIG